VAALGAAAWWWLSDREPAEAQAEGRSGPDREVSDEAPERPRLPTRTEPQEPVEGDREPGHRTLPEGHPDHGAEWDAPILRCNLDRDVGQSRLTPLVSRKNGVLLSRPGLPVSGEVAVLPVWRKRGRMQLMIEGYTPVEISWSTGPEGPICDPDPVRLTPQDDMTLVGQVINTAGNPEPRAQVGGCGSTVSDENGRFELHPVPAPCAVLARRQDGYWYSRSEPVEIPWQPGAELEIELVLNEYPKGGMGITIAEIDGVIGVSGVHADTPAQQAGLKTGDLILEVDGESTEGMGMREFVDLGTGEAGTEVDLLVESPTGRQRKVTVTREVLGP